MTNETATKQDDALLVALDWALLWIGRRPPTGDTELHQIIDENMAYIRSLIKDRRGASGQADKLAETTEQVGA